jgi:ADP-ribose pyrophosphatase
VKKIAEREVLVQDQSTGYTKKVLAKDYMHPNGLRELFFIDKDKDSVQIFAVTESNTVLCVKQYRAGLEEYSVELPGGGVDEGESLVNAAIRELREETGFEPHSIRHLVSVPYSPYSTGQRHVFLAEGCKRTSKQDLDPNEQGLRLQEWDMDVFRSEIRKGRVRGWDVGYMALDALGKL